MSILPQTPAHLHPWITADLPKQHFRLIIASHLVDIAIKISFIGVATITMSTLVVPFFVDALTTRAILGISTMIIVPCLAKLISYLQKTQQSLQHSLLQKKSILQELEQVKNWSTTRLFHFFQSQGISLSKDSDPSLLLPVIARYRTRVMQVMQMKTKIDLYLQAKDIHTEDLKSRSRTYGWNLLERQLLPLKLEAACCLEVLERPTLTQEDTALELKKKTFTQRQFNRMYDHEDNYLRIQGKWISLTTVWEKRIQELKQEIFPKNLEAQSTGRLAQSIDSQATSVPTNTCPVVPA